MTNREGGIKWKDQNSLLSSETDFQFPVRSPVWETGVHHPTPFCMCLLSHNSPSQRTHSRRFFQPASLLSVPRDMFSIAPKSASLMPILQRSARGNIDAFRTDPLRKKVTNTSAKSETRWDHQSWLWLLPFSLHSPLLNTKEWNVQVPRIKRSLNNVLWSRHCFYWSFVLDFM